MKHTHCCHCGFAEKCQKLKAGKLGLLGGLLIVLHLLYHVAECLILPTVFLALSSHQSAEAAELKPEDLAEITAQPSFAELEALRIDFATSLQIYALKLE